MSMHAIRRSFLRSARRQVRTAELGHPILRLIMGLALALDLAAGHPLRPTVVLVAAIAAVFWRGAQEIRREVPAPSPVGNEQSPQSDGTPSPEESV